MLCIFLLVVAISVWARAEAVQRWSADQIAAAAVALSPISRQVLLEGQTEPSYSGRFAGTAGERYNLKDDGVYACALCALPLYDSEHKFVSGTGWPSFYDAYDRVHVSHVISRSTPGHTEVVCSRCGGHLGHAFPDRAPPALARKLADEGKTSYLEPFCFTRHCVNAAALRFVPRAAASSLR